jgi:hypothetical protein
VHLVGFTIGIYYDARTYERQICHTNCIKVSKVNFSCVKAITETNGLGNAINIKVHSSNESLAMAQDDVPLRELNSQTPEAKPLRSNRLRTSKSRF